MDSVGVFQEWNRIHSIYCVHTVEHLMHLRLNKQLWRKKEIKLYMAEL